MKELKKNIISNRVYISTIHSFINDFISPLFKNESIINYYLKEYGEKIRKNISNTKRKGNDEYRKKYGQLDLDTIKNNLLKKGLFYGKSQYSSFYYGQLGHDDLLDFTVKVTRRYPKLFTKINRRFDLIIIDEYQDTAESILSLFLDAVNDKTNVSLYLFGDSMQQIYQKYSEEMKGTLRQIENKTRKTINFRSNQMIIDLLNNIYNNSQRIQSSPDNMKIEKSDFQPTVYLVTGDERESCINGIVSEYPGTLVLYVFNRERFDRIGALDLFDSFQSMDKYGFVKNIHAVDVLLNKNEDDNPDILMRCLLVLYKSKLKWEKHEYGSFFKLINHNGRKFGASVTVKSKKDKQKTFKLWKTIFDCFLNDEITIGEFLDKLRENALLDDIFIRDVLDSEEYQKTLDVQLKELINLEQNTENVSTQHGVKGESHDSIIFSAEDSRHQPFINMFDFFELWSKRPMSLRDFEIFVTKYQSFLTKVDKDKVKTDSKYGREMAFEVCNEFHDDFFFKNVYKDYYKNYIKKQTQINLKKVFSSTKIERILLAYKLFYVGCSRARRNLSVVLDKSFVEGFKDSLIIRFKKIGFTVIDC
ncbi:putative DNA helicase [Pediococcus damnosus]|nr:UvrD-helicase domain-containing protein [Pediococcus damnosus]AMV69337.1 putative DNA helicase [Pediococcus damnosus]